MFNPDFLEEEYIMKGDIEYTDECDVSDLSNRRGKSMIMEEDPEDDEEAEDESYGFDLEEQDAMWNDDYDLYSEGSDCEEGEACSIPVNRGTPECPNNFQEKRKIAYAAGPTHVEVDAELTSKMDLRFDDDDFDSQTVPNVGIMGTSWEEVDPDEFATEDDPDDGFVDIDPSELDAYNYEYGDIE